MIKKSTHAPAKPLLILGIDPGLADTGFGLIEKNGQKLKFITCGTFKTKAKTDFNERLKQIHQQLNDLIKKFKPGVVAIEQLFFCKNVKTALQVGQARGVCLLTVQQHQLPCYEYTPLQIKQALTGYGRAEKKQICQMVKILLNIKELPKSDDATDALAIAITCDHFLGNKIYHAI
jgi:crossover junction endodeoxyribonuclease RuvC